MKKTILLTMAIAVIAISLFVYGCKQQPAQETSAPAAPAAPQETAVVTEEPASDLIVDEGIVESNPEDLPVPTSP